VVAFLAAAGPREDAQVRWWLQLVVAARGCGTCRPMEAVESCAPGAARPRTLPPLPRGLEDAPPPPAHVSHRSAQPRRRGGETPYRSLTINRRLVVKVCVPQGRKRWCHLTAVTRLLVDLPDSLREEWRQLVTSAAGRNPRTPDGHFREMLEKHSSDWERAAESRSLPTERTKP
jgi:hypothetical protein